MIVIQNPKIEEYRDRARLTANIDVDGTTRAVWFEVDPAYGEFLCFERSDAFVVGLLNWAMRNGHDIVCEAPVTEELLYQITEFLIPSLSKSSNALKAIKIEATTAPSLSNARAVGTGISCGIDSFHVLAKHINSNYNSFKLTHLVHNNVGAFDVYKEKSYEVREALIKRAQKVADAVGLKLIVSDSNLASAFPQNHSYTHSFSSCFAVHALQKLWTVYYYASGGHTFAEFNLNNNERLDSANYDLLTLDCFSTRSLKIYSEGGAKTRLEKTMTVADYLPARTFLHVCLKESNNCGVCMKCRRTLVMLDALNKLDEFNTIFDVKYYRRKRGQYMTWMVRQFFLGDSFMDDPVSVLRNKVTPLNWVCGFSRALFARGYRAGANNKLLRRIFLKRPV
jgi:hypothetical protein